MNEIGMEIFDFFVELAGVNQLSQLLASFDNLDQSAKNILSIVGLFICVIGLLQCFIGYKMFKFWCGVIGFFIGFTGGLALGASGVFSASPAASLISFLITLLFAINGAFIAYRLYLAGLFIYVFFTAFSLVFYLLAFLSDSITAGLIVGAIVGITLGVIAIIYRKFWIITATSVYGGVTVCLGIMMIMQTTAIGWFFVLPPFLMAAGFFVQYATVKKKEVRHLDQMTVTPQIFLTQTPPLYPPDPAQASPVDSAVPVQAAPVIPVVPTQTPSQAPPNPAVPVQPPAFSSDPVQPLSQAPEAPVQYVSAFPDIPQQPPVISSDPVHPPAFPSDPVHPPVIYPPVSPDNDTVPLPDINTDTNIDNK